jgi:hypothetical protein
LFQYEENILKKIGVELDIRRCVTDRSDLSQERMCTDSVGSAEHRYVFMYRPDSSAVRMITLIDSYPPFSRGTCQQCRIPEPSPGSQRAPPSGFGPSQPPPPKVHTSHPALILFVLLHTYIYRSCFVHIINTDRLMCKHKLTI